MTASLEKETGIPPLEAGDRLTSDEFERRYAAMPEVKKAELIEGVVYMPSPVSLAKHGEPQSLLVFALAYYRIFTPGVKVGDNSTLRLDRNNQPQPDLLMMIDRPDLGIGTITVTGYVVGAVELVAEIASTSVSYDLDTKMDVYRRAGVKEYLVWRVNEKGFDWFAMRGIHYERLAPRDDGIFCSKVFPGLWLDTAALLRDDMLSVLKVLQAGVASTEHVAFVAQLAAASTPI